MGKKFYLSKTLWFNLLALVAVVAGAYGYTGELDASVAPFVPVVIAVVNAILRYFFTDQSLRG